MKKGIVCLGEALIDFIPLDPSNLTYQKSPGGAPANVAVGLARLGAKSTFIGKIGDDVLGRFLQETLEGYGVNTKGLSFSKEVRTGTVFVSLTENGERSFDFFIDPSADRFLEENDLKEDIFKQHKILHIGSISMISEPAKSTTIKAVRLAKENGMLISFDPNLRLSLWKSEDQARQIILEMLPHADILKISDEELEFLTGESDIHAGIARLSGHRIPLVCVTLGSKGSKIFTRNGDVTVEALKVETVDTTGAGDAYVSGILFCIDEYEGTMEDLSAEDAVTMGRFASVSGALAASSKGAMTALPTMYDIKKYLAQ